MIGGVSFYRLRERPFGRGPRDLPLILASEAQIKMQKAATTNLAKGPGLQPCLSRCGTERERSPTASEPAKASSTASTASVVSRPFRETGPLMAKRDTALAGHGLDRRDSA